MSIEANPIEQIESKRVLRDTRINLRGTRTELELIRHAAESTQKSLTEFVLESAAIAAERVLADRREFSLDSKAWIEFQAALERPAVLKPRLQALLNQSEPFID